MAPENENVRIATSRGGEESRNIYNLQKRIDYLENMRGIQFTLGVMRVGSFLPKTGITSSF